MVVYRLPPNGHPPKRIQIFAETGSQRMEKGGGLSHRTPAYNASAAEFYKLYSLQTCSDKPSASNPRTTSCSEIRPLKTTIAAP